jgi:hypothetical protein
VRRGGRNFLLGLRERIAVAAALVRGTLAGRLRVPAGRRRLLLALNCQTTIAAGGLRDAGTLAYSVFMYRMPGVRGQHEFSGQGEELMGGEWCGMTGGRVQGELGDHGTTKVNRGLKPTATIGPSLRDKHHRRRNHRDVYEASMIDAARQTSPLPQSSGRRYATHGNMGSP